MSATYSLTVAESTEPDAIAKALRLAREDELSIVGVRDTIPAGDGWQVILDVERITVPAEVVR